MRLKQAVGALLQLLVVMLLFSVSAFFIFLSHFPYLRFEMAEMLLHDPEKFRFYGFVLLSCALLLTLCWKASSQYRTIRLKMGNTKVSLGGRLLKGTLAKHMNQMFPNRFSLSKLSSEDGKKLEIHLKALPSSPPIDEEMLLKIEEEFSKFLARQLGYTGEFYLRVEKEDSF